jgi:nucleoside-diphosphate-sugar epimerase
VNHVLFNGQTGGLGRYMADALKSQNISFWPLRSRLADPDGTTQELNDVPTSAGDVVTLIPFAGLVPVVVCEREPERAMKTNVTDTLSLVNQFLDWARRRQTTARVLYVSTGHVYAPKPARERLDENDPVSPRSVYARTKLQAEYALRASFRNDPNALIIARVFGLLSPAQPLPYVLPSLIRRVKSRDFSNMSGLDCVRDYLDSRDVCRLLATLANRDWATLSRPENGVFNVASGEATAIRELFELVLNAMGLQPVDIEADLTEAPARADDIPWMVGNPSRLHDQLRIAMRSIALRETIREAVAYNS